MLPRELWIYILKIKWWNARIERLEKILKFPKRSGATIFAELYEVDEIYNFRLIHDRLYWEYSIRYEDDPEFERWNGLDIFFQIIAMWGYFMKNGPHGDFNKN